MNNLQFLGIVFVERLRWSAGADSYPSKEFQTMAKRCDVSIPDRREAVLSLLRREEPATVIARRVGVSEQTLYRWRDEFLTAGEAALTAKNGKADPRDRRIAELEKEIERRDQVIGEYTIANRIFEKYSDAFR